MRPIASCATSPGSMSSSSAPAIPSICAPTSPRCSPRPCPRRIAPGSRASLAIWSGSGWTLPICRGPRAPEVPDLAGGVMDYVNLGRTGLKVSVAGLGCGCFSRLRLGTYYLDIFQLHGVAPEASAEAREVIAPALLKEQAKV